MVTGCRYLIYAKKDESKWNINNNINIIYVNMFTKGSDKN